MTNNELFENIRQWGRDRGLDKQNSLVQFETKLVGEDSETQELWKALVDKSKPQIIDGIGDCVVVLTMIAMQEGLKIEDCIASAYEEIKNRKGKLVNGVFVKDAVKVNEGSTCYETQDVAVHPPTTCLKSGDPLRIATDGHRRWYSCNQCKAVWNAPEPDCQTC